MCKKTQKCANPNCGKLINLESEAVTIVNGYWFCGIRCWHEWSTLAPRLQLQTYDGDIHEG